MKRLALLLLPLGLVFMSTQCNDDVVTTQEDDLEELTALQNTIETLANSSVCNETTE